MQLEAQTVQTVSATLGKDSLRAGIVSGFIGLGLVALYMVVYYRALGLVVWLGLAVSGAVMYAVVSLLGQTSGSPSPWRERRGSSSRSGSPSTPTSCSSSG